MADTMNLQDWKRRVAELLDALLTAEGEYADGDAEIEVCEEARENLVAHLRTDPVIEATPLPADAALIGKLRHQLAQATDEAARLRALSQPEVAQVPEAINAVYFDVPANPRSAYVMGWNDYRESLLSAAPSAKGGEG